MSEALATTSLVSRPSPLSRIAVLGVALGLVLPILVVRTLGAACADSLGDRIGSGLSVALGPVTTALAPTSEAAFSELEPWPGRPALRTAAASTKGAYGGKHGKRPSLYHAIHISSTQVLGLAAQRAMPDAAPVHATAEHPAGLLLRGVSALGVGLQDGDVLTEAAGQRAASVATVIGVVLAARARHSPEISGRFFRAGVPYLVTVEQPYPPGT